MESANFHHHQQQENHQLNLVDSSCYELSWNGARNHTNSRDVTQTVNQNIDIAPVSMESFMAHELQHLGRIKNELSVIGSYSELPDIISSSPTSSVENFMSKNDHQRIGNNHHNTQDMLLKTFSNRCQIKSDQLMNQVPSYEESVSYSNDTNSCYRGTFSQIFPTLNISYLNQSSTSSISSSTFDINLPAIDPIGFQPSSFNVHNVGGLFKDNCLSNGFDHLQYSKIAPEFFVETTEAKRPANSYMDAKEPKATPTKKSKLELRPSCTPMKVRKEKLGDRISSLQQMVAPFGKTDTASVLMEAIGYIKFLQSQVETLSVPYMKSKHKASRISTQRGSIKDVNEDIKRDLRSQGLCLVPISCLSYVTYEGGSVWATP